MRKKLLLVLICAIAVLAVAIPAFAQQEYADVDGFFMAKSPAYIYDTDNTRYAFPYPYVGFELVQNDTVEGYFYGFNATSVTGSRVLGGTVAYNATIVGSSNRQNLIWGSNTVNATATGTLGMYIKTGCIATATNGTGTVVGSPVTLAVGWNTLNVTGAGTLTVYEWIDYTFIGAVVGAVGSSRIALVGPTLSSQLWAGNATIAGVSGICEGDVSRVFPPGGVFSVTGNGTATFELPTGSSGSADGDSLTINGAASINLTTGLNELVLSGAPGTLTINTEWEEEFQIAGKVTQSWWAGTYYITGRVLGFLVLDHDPWSGQILDFAISAKKWTWSPVLD